MKRKDIKVNIVSSNNIVKTDTLRYGYYGSKKICNPSVTTSSKPCAPCGSENKCFTLPAYTIVQTCNNNGNNNNRTGSGIVSLSTIEILVGGQPYDDIINFPWVASQIDNTTTQGILMFNADIPTGTSLTVSVFNGTTNVNIGSITINSTGFYTFNFTKPTTNCNLNIRFTKTGNGVPSVKGTAMKI